MHYRLPLYERLESDSTINSEIFYGKGVKGTKLVSANLKESTIQHKKQITLRIPFKTNNGKGTIPFSPFMFLSLLLRSPDVILSEGASSIINSSIGFVYSKIFGKKFIWWSLGKLEDREHRGLRGVLTRWERFIALKSNAIFTYSNLGKEHFIKEGVSPEKIFVGINVLDTDRKLKEISCYRKKNTNSCIDTNYYNLAFIGSITKEKNLIPLIKAVRNFNLEYKDVARLHIIGDGRFLKELELFLGDVNTDVILHGRINEGASKILKDCDVMILPGLGGLAICEAMLNSLPVITGKADGTEYDLVTNDCGFILPNITTETIFKKLVDLYVNPLKRKKMGKEAYKRITGELHFDNYYKKLKEAINFTQKQK